jgi:predicted transcriptional regulator
VRELQWVLTRAERKIANYPRAVARGDFASLETALRAAEQRRTALQAELASLDGNQRSAVVQLTPAALERHLQGLAEKLRSRTTGRVREAIEQSVARFVVGVDGSLNRGEAGKAVAVEQQCPSTRTRRGIASD